MPCYDAVMAVYANHAPAPASYTVKPGDTLSQIALGYYGRASEYPEIASRNHIANPDLIYPGDRLKLGTASAAAPAAVTVPKGDGDRDADDGYAPKHAPSYTPKHAAPTPAYSARHRYTFTQLENLWVQAGGPRSVAVTAACIAGKESGGDPTAENLKDNGGTQTSWGLWQISNGTHAEPVPNILDPLVNARAAVAKYDAAGGWGPWGTRRLCGA